MVSGITGSGGLLSNLLGTKKKDGTDDGFDITSLTSPATDDTGTDDVDGPDASSTDGMDAGTKEALDMLHDMTSGGMEGYFKYMVKQAREKAMSDLGVTEDSLKAMDPSARAAMEKKIDDMVKTAVAKIMGVDPDAASKMMTDAAQGTATAASHVDAAAKVEAGKAYKDGSTAEMLNELVSE